MLIASVWRCSLRESLGLSPLPTRFNCYTPAYDGSQRDAFRYPSARQFQLLRQGREVGKSRVQRLSSPENRSFNCYECCFKTAALFWLFSSPANRSWNCYIRTISCHPLRLGASIVMREGSKPSREILSSPELRSLRPIVSFVVIPPSPGV